MLNDIVSCTHDSNSCLDRYIHMHDHQDKVCITYAGLGMSGKMLCCKDCLHFPFNEAGVGWLVVGLLNCLITICIILFQGRWN